MDIKAIRQGLSNAAGAIAGLNCTHYVPDSVTEPQFFPSDVVIDFDKTFGRGQDEVVVTCSLLVGKADDRAAQEKLDGYLAGGGPTSVKAALEAARGAPGEAALGGACDDFRVERVQGYRTYQHAGATYLGAEFVVRIIGEGD